MLSRVLCLVIAVCFTRASWAQEAKVPEPSSWTPNGSLSFGIQDQYVARRFSRLVTDDPVLATDLIVNLPGGFYFNLWDTLGVDDINPSSNSSDELHLYLGWKGKVEDVDIKLSFGVIDFFPLSETRGDLIVGSLAIAKTFELGEFHGSHSLRPELRLDWLFLIDDLSVEAPTLLPSVRHVWKEPFGLKSVSLYEWVGLQWNDDLGRNREALFFQAEAGLEWKVSDQLKIVPNIFVVSPIINGHDGRGTEAVVSMKAVFTF